MNEQEVVFEHQARKELLEGASILANAVRVTMGPSGHNVIIDTGAGTPIITKDGVTVAKSVRLKNKLHSIGAELLKEVAAKTNDVAGDGTTTATVLAYALLYQGEKMISSGRSSTSLKRGMDLATLKVSEFLKAKATPVADIGDIKHIGTISANGDEQIGTLLADAMEKVGKDGIITIEEAKSLATTLEVVEGMRMDGGYVSPFFVTNSEKMSAELVNPYVLVTNKKLNSMQELLPVLELASRHQRSLLVIGEDIEGEALQAMVLNKLKGALQVCAVKAPSYGDHRDELLADIAILLGATFISNSSGFSLKAITPSELGTFCKKATITRYHTTFVADGSKEKLQQRIESLRNSLNTDASLDDLQKARIKGRLAKLAGGVAVIKVGGATATEMLERKDRVEDALNATMAAAEEGIVPGGGGALFHASLHLQELIANGFFRGLTEDERAGVEVVRLACFEPFSQILRNASKHPELIADKIKEYAKHQSATVLFACEDDRKSFEMKFGYDSARHVVCNMLEKGIIDPVKVERCSLEHATSIVGLMLTSDCIILSYDNPT